MNKRTLGRTGIEIAPLVFGGNVFGWTVDDATAFAMLDHFEGAGLNAIDTADIYSNWAPGNQGGESETTIGKWMKNMPGRREKTVVITKCGYDKGLSAKHILQAVEDSLRRLQTDYIDIYMSHKADPSVPIEETLGAYETLVKDGKVRVIGSSNYDAHQLREALNASKDQDLPRYEVHQPEYNLYSRDSFEGDLRDLCIAENIGVITYYSLASGFLSGKYRSKDDLGKSSRGAGVEKYLNPRGIRILDALDSVSARYSATPAEVALAWIIAREGATAPIASATSLAQVDSLIKSAQLNLDADAMNQLNEASAP